MFAFCASFLKSWMFVQEEFNSGSLTKFSNIQVAYRRSKGSAANKSKRNQPFIEIKLDWKKRSWYALCLTTFKILKSNAFPIKNHFSFDIDVSDMEVEENICKLNIHRYYVFLKKYIPRIKIASIRPSNTRDASTFCWWQLPTKSLKIKIKISPHCTLYVLSSYLKNAAL